MVLDDAPPVLEFPAPWRDLYRKSGRTLAEEFDRSAAALSAAEPATYVFADGTELSHQTEHLSHLRTHSTHDKSVAVVRGPLAQVPVGLPSTNSQHIAVARSDHQLAITASRCQRLLLSTGDIKNEGPGQLTWASVWSG